MFRICHVPQNADVSLTVISLADRLFLFTLNVQGRPAVDVVMLMHKTVRLKTVFSMALKPINENAVKHIGAEELPCQPVKQYHVLKV